MPDPSSRAVASKMTTFNKSLGEALFKGFPIDGSKRTVTSTTALDATSREILATFRFVFPLTVEELDLKISGAGTQVDRWRAVDNAHVAGQKVLMQLLDGRLLARAAVLQAALPDPDIDTFLNPRSVLYGDRHPRSGGTDPTDWSVVYLILRQAWTTAAPLVTLGQVQSVTDGVTVYVVDVDYTQSTVGNVTTLTSVSLPPSVTVIYSVGAPVVEYSHTVGWDSDSKTLSYELGWNNYQVARMDIRWGSFVRLNIAGSTSGVLDSLRTLVAGREQASEAMGGIIQHKQWITSGSLVLRWPSFRVFSGSTVFEAGVHYRVQTDRPRSGDTTLQKILKSGLPDFVTVEAI